MQCQSQDLIKHMYGDDSEFQAIEIWGAFGSCNGKFAKTKEG